MAIRDIQAQELAALGAAGAPLLVDFVTGGCPWCARLVPELERVAEEWAGRVEILRLNLDENPDAAAGLTAEYGLRGAPTLVLMRGGERLGSKRGFQRAQQINAFLRHHLD